MKTRSTGSFNKIAASLLACIYLSGGLAPAYASDTEVYARKTANAEQITPTLMFLLDTSGSMKEYMGSSSATSKATDCTAPHNGLKTRWGHLECAMKKVLMGDKGVTPMPGSIRGGLTFFNNQSPPGGFVRLPARPLDALVDINPNGTLVTLLSGLYDDAEQPEGTSSLVTNSSELDIGYEDDGKKQDVGIRVPFVMIPMGASVVAARLVLTPLATSGNRPTLAIHAQATGNAPDFNGTNISSRSYLATSQTELLTEWTANEPYKIDVTSLVQEVANRSDWCGGNAIMFRISDISGDKLPVKAYTFERQDSKSPYLEVSFTVDKTKPSCLKQFSTPASPTIANRYDDAEWAEGASSASSIRYGESELDVAADYSGVRNQSIMRFANVSVAKGVTVEEAYLQLRPGTGDSYPILEVMAYDASNFTAFCTVFKSKVTCNLPSATLTSPILASTDKVTDTGDTTNVGKHRINITSLVQALINKSGWNAGNAMGFLVRREASQSVSNNDFLSYDGSSSSSDDPTLVIRTSTTLTSLAGLKTVREEMWEAIDNTNPSANTPLATSYVEMASYLMGGEVFESRSIDSAKDSTTGNSKYLSPIDTTGKCAGNFIYMLTDGEPNNDGNAEVNGSDLLGGAKCGTAELKAKVYDNGNLGSWSCMFNIAQWLSSGNNNKDAVVQTSTVAFGPDIAGTVDLKNVAEVYGGNKAKFYAAGDASGVVASIQETVKSLFEMNGTIAAPGVAVNQLSRLTHLDQLYYAVFDPNPSQAAWEGNVKKYRLDLTGSTPVIRDREGRDAVNDGIGETENTGFFKDGTSSFWPPAPAAESNDGSSAVSGGVSANLPTPATRKMYTYMGTYPTGSATALMSIDTTNASFNTSAKSAMGVSDDTVYKNLMSWFRGYNLKSTQVYSGAVVDPVASGIAERKRIGGVLHSRPLVINYGYTDTGADDAVDLNNAESNADLQDNYLVFGSMGGTLHVVNAYSGIEKFSFTPRELFPLIKKAFDNPSQEDPDFGLDLSLTIWRKDANGDFKITTGSSGDVVYLYSGMRMGGSSYYALDITDLNGPRVVWMISPSTSTAFAKLGQTWSQPTLGAVKINGTVKNVLFFGGGYDDKHETAGYTSPDSDGDAKGNQIYIVDAKTGQLYWWASNSGSPTKTVTDMKFSIPSELKVRDLNGDGLVDAIYFGDLGGQVFRMDIDNGNASASNLVKRVRLLAKIGQTVTADTANQRRIYEAPAVAQLKDNLGKIYAAVAVGSGYRSHPLDKGTDDAFYVFSDYDAVKSNVLTLADGDLASTIVPSELVKLDLASASGVSLTGKRGWYIDLPESGEKVLSTPLVFNGEVWLTSYMPDVVGGNECSPVIGRSKLWRMALKDGQVITDWNTSGTMTPEDRYRDNFTMGLGGDPQLIINKVKGADGKESYKTAVCVGTSCITGGDLGAPQMRRMRWFEKAKQ